MSEARAATPASSARAPSLTSARIARSTISSSEMVRAAMPASAAERPDERLDLGIRRRLARLVVAIPAVAALLPEPAHRHQPIVDERPALARVAEVAERLLHARSRRRARPCRRPRTCPSPSRSRSARDRPAPASRLPRRGTASRTCRGTSAGCRRSPARCRRRRPACAARLAKASALTSTPGSVRGPRTISRSRITAAGLKKCRPTTASGRDVAPAIASMSSVDVLVARMHPGFATAIDLAEHPLLEREILEHRFDDQIRLGDARGECRGRRQMDAGQPLGDARRA